MDAAWGRRLQALALPVPDVAPRLDDVIGGDMPPLVSPLEPGYFMRAFNYLGLPALAVPCGFSSEGLPIGLHIIGRRGDEATVLRASAAFERTRPWLQHRPPID